MTKAYALLWGKCAKGMQNKIEFRQDYKSIQDDPMRLLQAIKEHSLNYQENRYPMSILIDSLRALLNARQREAESLQDYTKCFRVTREVLEAHIGGPIILTRILQSTEDYEDADEEEKLKVE